jgi:hypothetical protein
VSVQRLFFVLWFIVEIHTFKYRALQKIAMASEAIRMERQEAARIRKLASDGSPADPKGPISRLRRELLSNYILLESAHGSKKKTFFPSQEKRSRGLGFLQQAEYSLEKLEKITQEAPNEGMASGAVSRMQQILAGLEKLRAQDAIRLCQRDSLLAFMADQLPQNLSESAAAMRKIREFSSNFLEDGQDFIVRKESEREYNVLLPPHNIKVGTITAWEEKIPPGQSFSPSSLPAVRLFYPSNKGEQTAVRYLQFDLSVSVER